MAPRKQPFTFIDLFAGIGLFHSALAGLGGKCVYAIEIDSKAAAVYERNWGMNPLGDITADVTDTDVLVPPHDVLTGGFPCQPFGKSGAQRGMEETRGTLYWSILQIIKARRPALVVLENVRNLAGPRHLHEWDVIISTLRAEGYRVSSVPGIFSPHLLSPEMGGRPQVRERVFIVAVRDDEATAEQRQEESPVVKNKAVVGWNPQNWNLAKHLPLIPQKKIAGCELSESEILWIDAWNDFVEGVWEEREGVRLPGFPFWADAWILPRDLDIPEGTPKWKRDILTKNAHFYADHKEFIDQWLKKWDVRGDRFPVSRQKFEWQAQDTPRLWDTVLHMRPSGIRAKRPTYLPALVAITQTSIIGSKRRRLSPREAARLQSVPDWFDFGDQPDSATYKQLGNAVSSAAVWYVVRQAVLKYEPIFKKSCPQLLEAVKSSSDNPDEALAHLHV